jgi:hypothetical protein
MKRIEKISYNGVDLSSIKLIDRINDIIDALDELNSDIEYLKMLNPPKSSFQNRNPYDLSNHPLKRKHNV